MICNNCGTYLREDATFCPKCGMPTAPSAGMNSGRQPQSGQDNNRGLIIAIIAVASVLVLLISVIAAFLWMSGQSSNEPTPSPTPTASPINTPEVVHTTPTPAPVKESAYEVYKGDVTWSQAQSVAQSRGGHLVCINSPEEFERVCSMAKSKGIFVFWLGAARGYGQSWEEVKWDDGTYMSYTKWLRTDTVQEPTYISETGEEENFLMAFKVGSSWYYNDSQENVNEIYPGKIGYIIEYEG